MKNEEKIIAWFSGGVTSAVTCKLCIDLYGTDNVRIVFIDTKNEDPDTYRFLLDCEAWYDKSIEVLTGIGNDSILPVKYNDITDVWRKYKSLNVAHGAICSNQLKRRVREVWQKTNSFKYQAFGFDVNEVKRAKGMTMNNSNVKPIYPLLLHGLSKKDCVKIIQDAGVRPPAMYGSGFLNNNCGLTGCVQGGIGYWKKIESEYPEKYNKMANLEHELTNDKGKPVTMLRSQRKDSYKQPIFLKPHPNYPDGLDLSMFEGRKIEPLFECNGFCGVNDLIERKHSEGDINFMDEFE